MALAPPGLGRRVSVLALLSFRCYAARARFRRLREGAGRLRLFIQALQQKGTPAAGRKSASPGRLADGGTMPFTQEEAVQKVGKQVRVRDDSLLHEGIAQGTSATVVDAYRPGEDGWLICVQFTFASDHWLLLPFRQEEYARTLEELSGGTPGIAPPADSRPAVGPAGRRQEETAARQRACAGEG